MDAYTQKMEDASFRQWEGFDNYNEDYSSLIQVLNSKDMFRSFGDGLLFFLKKRQPELTEETAVKYIESLCAETGVSKSDIASSNTLKSWFKGGPRPKKGDDSRASMFALAFALRLTPDETAELFHKVYLDRAFDYRNADEIIYYYCLNNQKTWEAAKHLIELAQYNNVENADATVYTSQIKTEIESMTNDEALLSYIAKHGHNLAQKSVSAKQTVERLLVKAKELSKEDATERMIYKDRKEEPVYKDVFAGYDKDSNSFTYTVITDLSVSSGKGTKTLFKNARLPKEIKSRFPEAGVLSKNDLTYEELRKLIILLASYNYWYQARKGKVCVDIDDYIASMNEYLDASGFSPMYYGNPYDWLFLYCSLFDLPLDQFRGLLAEVLDEE